MEAWDGEGECGGGQVVGPYEGMHGEAVADDSSLRQAIKLKLKGRAGSSRSTTKPDAETSHAPTTQDNSGAFSAVIPLSKVRREVSH
jgi:hypothetical protein